MPRVKCGTDAEDVRSSGAGTFVAVLTPDVMVYVTPEWATIVEKQLDSIWRPTWIRFVDVDGSRVRIHRKYIKAMWTSDELIRQRNRDFHHKWESETPNKWDYD